MLSFLVYSKMTVVERKKGEDREEEEHRKTSIRKMKKKGS